MSQRPTPLLRPAASLLLACVMGACGADETPRATATAPVAPPPRAAHASSTLGPGYKLSLNANVTTVAADGAQSIPLVATLTDWRGRPITGAPIVFGASGSANDLFSPARAVTNCAGVARSQVASARAGQQSLSASYSKTTARLDGTFTCPGPFLAPVGWPVFPSQIFGGTLVDLDLDGRLDIVAPTMNSNTLSVMLGNGNASFSQPVSYPVLYSSTAVAGDLNNDGNPDVLVPNYNAAAISVLLGRGDGSLGPAAFYASGPSPTGLALGDFNGDSNTDVAVSHLNSAFVGVYLGRGDGTLQTRVDFTTAGGSTGLAVGDMNRDNKLDLVVPISTPTNSLSILFGSGTGSFAAPISTTLGSVNPYSVALGDLNRDGKMDAVVPNLNSTFLSVLLNNNGNGAFTSVVTLPGSNCAHAALADFNGDGNLDLVGSNFNSALAYTYTGDGNGTFTAGSTYTVGTNPRISFVTDLNGDNNADIATFSQTSASVALHLGSGNGSFKSIPNAKLSANANRVAVGKLSNDANITAYVGHSTTNATEAVQILADGTLSPPITYVGQNNGQAVTLGDLNRDNRVDVVISYAGTAQLGVMVGNGNGTFQAAVQYPSPVSCIGPVVADLNKDTYPDVAVACLGIPGVAVYLGNAAGNLGTYTAYTTTGSTYSLAVTDLNLDTNPDVVVLPQNTSVLSVLLGNGNGTLQPHVTNAIPAGGLGVAAGLLNQDSYPDIVVSNQTPGTVSVLLGNGTSTLTAAVAYSVTPQPTLLGLGDVNGDGDLDIVVRGVGVSTLYNNGNGTFGSALTTVTGSGNGLGLYDLNADGLTDALLSNNTNQQLQVLYASRCQSSSTYVLSADNAANYSYSSSGVTFGNAAELRPTYGDNTSSAFTGGTPVGVAYDSSAQQLRLGNAGGCNALSTNCAALDSSWTPAYGNITHYYRFDGSGTATAGTSLSAAIGPPGTLTGASATYQAAHLGTGLNLIGNGNAYVALTANNPNAAAFTFTGWTKWFGGNANQRLFDFGTNTTAYASFTPMTGGTPQARLVISNSGVPGEARASTAQAMPTQTWMHVAATLDGTTAKLYLNGSLAASVATALSLATVKGPSNLLGRSQWGNADPAYNGVVDEVALYSVALDANQIALLYARQAASFAGTSLSQVFGPQSSSPTAWTDLAWNSTLPFYKELPSNGLDEATNAYTASSASLDDGLTLLYHFNEAATGTVAYSRDFYDDSGFTNHGLQSGGVTANAAGLLGTAASFPGGSGTVSSRFTYANPNVLTVSAWFATDTTAGGKIVGFGDVANGSSVNFDRHVNMTNAGQLIFGCNTGVFNTLTTSGSYNDGRWHHVTAVLSTTGMLLYVDGALKQQNALPGAQAYTGYWRIGGDNLTGWPSRPTSDYFRGRIDEVAIYSRDLSASEVLQLYRRGANRVKLQVRACSSATCADNPNWLGPDGTAYSYFTERNNNALPATSLGTFYATAPSLRFASFAPSLNVPQNPYMQYRMALESDDEQTLCTYNGASAACSPEVQSVRVGPTPYPTAASVTSLTGTTFGNLTSLSTTYGSAGCPSGASFAFSRNGGTTWHYWNGYKWAGADGSAIKSTPASQLNATVMAQFASQVGSGSVLFRAFLNSTGSTPCALSQVTLTGTP